MHAWMFPCFCAQEKHLLCKGMPWLLTEVTLIELDVVYNEMHYLSTYMIASHGIQVKRM
jgi:hypothetical protein